MASRVPPLLEPYLRLPPETSLIVLTSVLGASTNWLVQRYLCSLLATSGRSTTAPAAGDDGHDESTAVVLVSFLRDYAFWKDSAGRSGVDLDALSRKGRFAFVDGLSGLFSGGSKSAPGHGKNGMVLSSPTLQDLSKLLNESIAGLQNQSPDSEVILILDNPDLLLAATGESISGEALRETLLDVREVSALVDSHVRTDISLRQIVING
jgi:elongator complex protein 6